MDHPLEANDLEIFTEQKSLNLGMGVRQGMFGPEKNNVSSEQKYCKIRN